MKHNSFILLLVVSLILAACTNSTSSNLQNGYGLTKTKPDPLCERQIQLSSPNNHEHLNLVYFHDGDYDLRALKKIDFLFRDRHANVIGKIDPELIDYLVDIRTRLGLPPSIIFEILSGFRTPETNRKLAHINRNVANESFHIHGWAVDFRIQGVDGRAICEVAKTMQRGGVAFYPADNHVHIDLGNIRTWHQK